MILRNEPRGSYRAVEANPRNAREIARTTRSRRGRQVRSASLPIPSRIRRTLQATEQGQQGSRVNHYLELPDRAEPRIQWRLPRMGALLRIRE